MKNRRSKLEIYIDVLKTIKEGTTKPTRIMYGANLSWKLLQGVLESLVDQDLIEEVDQSGSRDKRTNVIYTWLRLRVIALSNTLVMLGV